MVKGIYRGIVWKGFAKFSNIFQENIGTNKFFEAIAVGNY